jgi:hypothetical protein
VAAPLGHAWHQRQDRRRAVERLDLRLLIDTEHDRRIGRVEIQPDVWVRKSVWLLEDPSELTSRP